MRQVVNAPVGNPRRAGTDEGDRSLVGGKGERGPCTPPPARGSQRDRVSVAVSLVRSPCPPRSLLQPRSVLLSRSSGVPLPPSSTPSFLRRSPTQRLPPRAFPLSFGVSFFLFFPFRLFLLAAAADAQPVLHRQIDSTLRTSRWSERGSSSRIPEFAPVG